MIHMTLRKKTLWFLGALSFFASLAATFAVFWLNRNDSSPAEWNFNPIWTKAEKEQILTVANFTAHRSPERFIYRGLSLNSRHIDWHMFSEVSMRQYMKDEIRERLQMIRDTAESADGRCITPSHETLLHLAAGLGEVQLLNRLYSAMRTRTSRSSCRNRPFPPFRTPNREIPPDLRLPARHGRLHAPAGA